MENYKREELTEALRAINSIIHKCEIAQEKFPEGKSQHTLLKNRLKAMCISKALITDALSKIKPSIEPQTLSDDDCNSDLLISNLDQLHTTDLGAERIQKNLRLDIADVVSWCKEKIKAPGSIITQRGKNWYVAVENYEITVNAHSYTIITAHKQPKKA